MHQEEVKNVTIIGAGNGGHAVAGYLGLTGHSVKLYDIDSETVKVINDQEGIYLEGEINGFGPIQLATTDIGEALKDADMVIVVTPSIAHRNIAESCAPHLKDNQTILLHPGGTFGALYFKNVLEELGCNKNVMVAESSTLIYACRLIEAGKVYIAGIKNRLFISSIPAKETVGIVNKFKSVYPQMEAVSNIFITSLDNTNPIVHPGPTLLSTSLIESGRDWLYYRDGITPSISSFIEGMDGERCNIGRALELELPTLKEQYEIEYDVFEKTLYDVFQKTEAYANIKGQNTLRTRYLYEDIPNGLVPLASLGKFLGVSVDRIEVIIKLAELMTNEDFTAQGRTLENLGLSNMTVSEILSYVQTGNKQK